MTGIDRPTLHIDLAAIESNWRLLCARHAGPVAAVLKADGYGLGAGPIACRLHAAGCRHFFVALPEEAASLPPLPDSLVGVLNGPGGTIPAGSAQAAPVLGNLDDIARMSAAALAAGRVLPCMLHVDTGMCRLGLDPSDVALLRAQPARLDGLDIRYVMTHLASADRPGDPTNAAQLAAFRALDWLKLVPRSLANSSGIFLGPDFASDLARPGAALFGVNPTPGRPNPMRDVLRLDAPILQIREIAAGTRVGYGGAWVAARASRIAVLGVGYADGWHRALEGRGQAVFDGRAVPLVGRVSMDLTTYDVTDTGAVAGCILQLIGPERPLAMVAAEAGTNEYEIMTSLGRRYDRVTLA